MNVEKDDTVENLITRCLTGEASAEEQAQLENWRAQNSGNEKHFQNFQKTFDWSNRHFASQRSQNLNINIDREWSQFLHSIQPEQAAPVRSVSGISLWMRMAAAVLLLVTAGAATYYWVTKNSVATYQTAANTLTVKLSDGSQVVLNQHSVLTCSRKFGEGDRSVTLIGEAFFEVAHNPDLPFVIGVGEAEVQVVGTSFNVSGYQPNNQVEVVVATGTVRLSAPLQKKHVTLHAGAKGVYAPKVQQLTSEINRDVNFASWKTRTLVFEETDLRRVVEALNRTYGANIRVSTEVPATCEVTVSFEQQSLEAVLNVLKNTLNLTYRGEGNSIEITGAGC